MSEAVRPPPRIPWLRIVSVGFMLAGLAFCGATLYRNGLAQFSNLLHPAPIAGLALATVAVLVASTVAWREYFRAVSTCRLAFADAFYQLGIVLIGKYVPIILGGVLARVGANASRTSASNVVGATLLEQCGALASATAVAFAFLAGWVSPPAGIAVALVAVAATAMAPYAAGPAIAAMHRLRARIRRSDELRVSSIERAPVRIAWLAQLSAWAALSAFIALIIGNLRPDLKGAQIVFLVGAYLLAVMLGVAAFLLPGGIGAREAAFVWIAGRVVGYETALLMATAIRIAMTGIDLAAGVGCLGYGALRASSGAVSTPRGGR